MSPREQNPATDRSLRELCREVAGEGRVSAACECGEGAYSARPRDYGLFVILEDYKDGLRYHARKVNGLPATVLAADRSLVDLDAHKGAMGEFIVERLLTPYRTLENADLLASIEVDAKERILREELTELALEYGEMARELSIRAEYLMLARIRRRARVFLPAARTCAILLEPSVRDINLSRMAPGYRGAMDRLVGARILRKEGLTYALEDAFVDQSLSATPATKVINVVQAGRRALQAYLAQGRASYLTPDVLTRELMFSLERTLLRDEQPDLLEDPKRYLSVKTSTGQISLAERFSVEKLVGKFRPGVVVTVSPLGSVLNEVYMITAGNERLVAKKFTDWHSFKWFAIDLVSLGTRLFSVSGKARLENEYAMNRLLSRCGVCVPEILHVSLPDRILVQRYVEGSSLVELVERAVSSRPLSRQDLGVASKVGSTLAKIHASSVAMGDSKPENFLYSIDGEVYCLDLEQARKSVDKAWDVAEFLYYSGHYAFPTVPSSGFKEYVNAFIEGYRNQGDRSTLNAAASVKYARVFSLWTSPLALREISRALRRAA